MIEILGDFNTLTDIVTNTTKATGVVQVNDRSNSNTGRGPSYLSGENFVRPLEPVKGDYIRATPWNWTKLVVEPKPFFAENSVVTISESPWYKTHRIEGLGYDLTGYIVPSVSEVMALKSFPSSTQSSIKSTAILKAQANLRKQVASLPMLFLERKATLKTVGKYSKFILNNAITMQRKDVKRWVKAQKRRARPEQLKRLARDIANGHLEFVFGVMPVLDDIMSATEHFSKPRVDVRTGRGRDRLVLEEDIFNGLIGAGYATYKKNATTFVDYSVRTDLRCSITSHVKNDASLLGFNPIYVWYDSTPLSFIIGWFSNFNLWLQSIDPMLGLEYVTGSSSIMEEKSIYQHATFHKQGTIPSGSTFDRGETTSPVSNATYTTFSRVVHESMPALQKLQLVDKTSLFTHAASLSLAIQRFVKEGEREIKRKPFKYRGRRPRNLPPIKYRKVKL